MLSNHSFCFLWFDSWYDGLKYRDRFTIYRGKRCDPAFKYNCVLLHEFIHGAPELPGEDEGSGWGVKVGMKRVLAWRNMLNLYPTAVTLDYIGLQLKELQKLWAMFLPWRNKKCHMTMGSIFEILSLGTKIPQIPPTTHSDANFSNFSQFDTPSNCCDLLTCADRQNGRK